MRSWSSNRGRRSGARFDVRSDGRSDGGLHRSRRDDGAFEHLSVEPGEEAIGLALLPEGSARERRNGPLAPEIVAGARSGGRSSVTRKFGVCSCSWGRDAPGLIPSSETGVARDVDVAKTFPSAARWRSSSSKWNRPVAASG